MKRREVLLIPLRNKSALSSILSGFAYKLFSVNCRSKVFSLTKENTSTPSLKFSTFRSFKSNNPAKSIGYLGPAFRRIFMIDNYKVVDNYLSSLWRPLVFDNKTVFLFEKKTNLIVDNKRGRFVVENSFFQVCDYAKNLVISRCCFAEPCRATPGAIVQYVVLIPAGPNSGHFSFIAPVFFHWKTTDSFEETTLNFPKIY